MGKISDKFKEEAALIKTSDFDYDLPDSKIAKYPLTERSNSKLLQWNNGKISQSIFNMIPDILPKNSLLVFNNTKVVRARLIFFKETGAKIEIFCLEPFNPSDYQIAFQQTKQLLWRCIIGNAKKWKEGKLNRYVDINGKKILLSASKQEKVNNDYIVSFEWEGGFTFSQIIEQAGIIPIPPYLNRDSEETDKTRYQTVYAKIKGSVAAPTAGLHFTQPILDELYKNGIRTSELTLHVGAGTFQPVKSETIEGHEMHSETVAISKNFIQQLISNDKKIIAVGTTSVRSLESLYWIGIQFLNSGNNKDQVKVGQWEPYTNQIDTPLNKSLQAIINFLEGNKLKELHFSTKIIIIPGYKFRVIDGLFTNFHQPQSTLLLLISAFIGDDWKEVYNYALNNDFRFLSYGDSNIYLK